MGFWSLGLHICWMTSTTEKWVRSPGKCAKFSCCWKRVQAIILLVLTLLFSVVWVTGWFNSIRNNITINTYLSQFLWVRSASSVQLGVQNITFLFTVLQDKKNPYIWEVGTRKKKKTFLLEMYLHHQVLTQSASSVQLAVQNITFLSTDTPQ